MEGTVSDETKERDDLVRKVELALTSSEFKRGLRDGRNCRARNNPDGNKEYEMGYDEGYGNHLRFDD
jgi:hypothetical protein